MLLVEKLKILFRLYLMFVIAAVLPSCSEKPEPYSRSVRSQDVVDGKNASPSSNKSSENKTESQEVEDEESLEEMNDPPELLGPMIEEVADNMDQNVVANRLKLLSSDAMAGRLTGSAGHADAVTYFAGKLQEFGFSPAGSVPGSYEQGFAVNSQQTGNVMGVNVIGRLPGNGSSQEVIVVGAHLDHLGTQGAQVFNGADDNASGTTGVLSLAEGLSFFKGKLDRDILIIAFSGEELGLLGSKHFVANPTIDRSRIKFMLNLDMVGYGGGQVYGIRFAAIPILKELLTDRATRYNINLVYDDSKDGASDHISFAEVGIPVGTFHTGLHDNYHQITDTEEKIDYTSLTAISQMTFDFIAHAASLPNLAIQSLRIRPDLPNGYTADELELHSSDVIHGMPLLKPYFWDDETAYSAMVPKNRSLGKKLNFEASHRH
ncbi:M28 family peptidase [Pseudobacteriovorax antillogorgiicola]|uniref:Peptidase family M28 n=1 Tax=Pseudobacteriovorax antillogorgiicola TaxID=1513793 RepID=A0A1Y6BR79_9BACT|nr:M28 family peptidase [Pseudobacteriovorax antillogorgiicola]TCS53721.1 peptidase M28-like protein [Pseudobacteriovorax antillogorgiicola]SMF22837.1 Peptidase family M28 [Pseudobacteriovorax antillogorgiicola]